MLISLKNGLAATLALGLAYTAFSTYLIVLQAMDKIELHDVKQGKTFHETATEKQRNKETFKGISSHILKTGSGSDLISKPGSGSDQNTRVRIATLVITN